MVAEGGRKEGRRAINAPPQPTNTGQAFAGCNFRSASITKLRVQGGSAQCNFSMPKQRTLADMESASTRDVWRTSLENSASSSEARCSVPLYP